MQSQCAFGLRAGNPIIDCVNDRVLRRHVGGLRGAGVASVSVAAWLDAAAIWAAAGCGKNHVRAKPQGSGSVRNNMTFLVCYPTLI
jgi:hypothetical protein